MRKLPVKRNGAFTPMDVTEIVPGDVVFLRGGNVVPADSVWLGEEPLEIDQAALTGESLPVTKFEGETVFQGSCIKRGEPGRSSPR